MKLKVYRTKGVSVNCSFGYGVYVFQSESGSGKTFFFRIVESVCKENGVSCKFFNSSSINLSSDAIIKSANDFDVVIFDSADLYFNQEIADSLRDDQIVFVAMKNPFKLNIRNRKLVDIRYDGNSIKFSRREL